MFVGSCMQTRWPDWEGGCGFSSLLFKFVVYVCVFLVFVIVFGYV